MNDLNPDDFWSKVEKTETCWEWRGYKYPTGYGLVFLKNKTKSAHRISYELSKGIIPKDKEIDHICRNRSCVNPDHLEAVSHRENVIRGIISKYDSSGNVYDILVGVKNV